MNQNEIVNEDYADLIVGINSTLAKENARNVVPLHYRYSLLNIPISEIDKCSVGKTFRYTNIPNCYTLESIVSLEKSGIPKIQNNPVFGLTGKGVLIGLIDTGIHYQHEAFINADKTTKIYSIWDQTILSENTSPNVIYGTEYNKEIINHALSSQNPLTIVPSKDEIGHGTMIAGIIAGNESTNNNFRGVVPDSELVVVKLKQAKRITKELFAIAQSSLCYQETDIIYGIKYVVDIASQIKRPLVICIALGTNQGGHDGYNLLDTYLSFLNENSGIAVVISGGNEGNSRRHYMGTITSNKKTDEFELMVGENEQSFSMEIWQSAPNLLSIEGTSPSGDRITPIFPMQNDCRRISLVFERTVLYINNITTETESGDQLILIRFEYPSPGSWKFRVTNVEGMDSTFNVWLPSDGLLSENTYFTNSNPDITITSPANGFYPITVTAYNPVDDSIWLNSSRGYSRINTIKPELAAPGVNLTAPIANNQFGTLTGTGAAAAHTAGIAAMLLEWGIVRGNYSIMHGIEVKQILIRGAKRDLSIEYPNNIWGYGIIDVYSAFIGLR